MKNFKSVTLTSLGASLIAAQLTLPQSALALDNIVHPYQSIRSSGMGGVSLTTGLYDQNFFGNPARVLANPSFRFTLFDFMGEVDSTSINHVKDLSGSTGNEIYGKLGETAGSPNHLRIQTTLPSIYIPARDGKMAYAFGLLMSTQADFDLRRSYQIDPAFYTDIGPALTVGRKFLENDQLGVGITAHATYRLATSSQFTFIDLIKGNQVSSSSIGGQGAHLDFDLGGTYELPIEWLGAHWSTGAAMNNVLGGKYSNLSLHPISAITSAAPAQPRQAGFGGSARWDSLFVLNDVVAAVEITDIGNNPDGGIFRMVHLGAEGRWGLLSPRVGINQGYFAAGLGVNLKVITLDIATYGEEMSLNAGGLQDRRYAFKLALQI